MVVRSLKPTKDCRLGKLLLYQLPNLLQAYLLANYSFYIVIWYFNPNQKVTFLYITHPFAIFFTKNIKLACVKHATSVYSEPGSNSFYKLKNNNIKKIYEKRLCCTNEFSNILTKGKNIRKNKK